MNDNKGKTNETINKTEQPLTLQDIFDYRYLMGIESSEEGKVPKGTGTREPLLKSNESEHDIYGIFGSRKSKKEPLKQEETTAYNPRPKNIKFNQKKGEKKNVKY